jgi:hypothetical protein
LGQGQAMKLCPKAAGECFGIGALNFVQGKLQGEK